MFENVIKSLLRAGMSEAEIARRAHTTQPSVNRIKLGKQKPGYELGERLLVLHDEALGSPPPKLNGDGGIAVRDTKNDKALAS